jgi:cytochrome c553
MTRQSQLTTCTIGLALAVLAAVASAAQENELREALKLKPNHEHGRVLYDTCSACHQRDGAGVADGDIPSIAGQHYEVILKELVDFRDMERIDMRMEAFVARHHLEGPQDLADVAAYISHLPRQWTKQYGPGKHTTIGMQAYGRACTSCHGRTGEGDNDLRIPRLAGQHYGYLLKQMDMMIGGARFNVSWDHSKLLESLTDEEISGVADYLARQQTLTSP